MAAPIVISAQLNDTSIRQSAENVKRTFNQVFDDLGKRAEEITKKINSIGKGFGGASNSGLSQSLKEAATNTLALAQAQARLEAANGQLTRAQRTLADAISQTDKETVQVIKAKTQYINIGNQMIKEEEALTRALERKTAALVAQAQAQAKAQAAAGNFSAAQSILKNTTTQLSLSATQQAQIQSQLIALDQKQVDSQEKKAAAVLRAAQAQARLQTTSGDLNGAQRTLQQALNNTTLSAEKTYAAQTQLVNVQQRIAQSAVVAVPPWRRYASTVREAGESLTNVGYVLANVGRGILNFGQAAVSAALDIDKQVNTIKALTGSAAAAEARFEALFKLAQKTPGLTTQLAATLDAQLRLAGVSEKSIDRVLPAIGRLNAVSPIADVAKFTQNLVQLATQGFERQDLKELVGNSPVAGLLIKQIFQVDSPINSAAIKEAAAKLGINSVEALFTAIAREAERNPALASVTESLGTQFDKLQDRISVALRPLGKTIIDAILPAVNALVPVIETLSNAFAALPKGLQTTIVLLGLLAAAIGPIVIGIGAFVQATGAILNLEAVLSALSASVVANTAAMAALTPTAVATTAAVVSMEAEIAAAGTAIGASAASFSLFNPILLGIVAVLGVAAIAWATYTGEAEKALEVAQKQLPANVYEARQLQISQEALQQKTVATNELNRAIELLNPNEQAYIATLTSKEQKIQRVTQALQEQQNIQKSLIDVQTAITVRGLIPQAKAFADQTALVGQLKLQFEEADRALKQYGSSQEQVRDVSGAVITAGSLVRGTYNEVGAALTEAQRRAAELAAEAAPLAKALIDAGGGADGARQMLDRLASSGALTRAEADAAKAALDAFARQSTQVGDKAAKAAVRVFNLADALRDAGVAGAQADLRKRIEEAVKQTNGNVSEALKTLADQGVTEKSVGGLNKIVDAIGQVEEKVGLNRGGKRRGPKPVTEESVFTKLAREVAKLKIELDALEKGGGRIFQIELDKAKLEEAKRQASEILKLRQELGINEFAEVPKTTALKEAELRVLNREKQTREEILKLSEAQADAEAKLRVSRAREIAPEVETETQVALAISETRIKRREQETKSVVAATVALRSYLDVVASENATRFTARQDQVAELDEGFLKATERRYQLEERLRELESGRLQEKQDGLFLLEAENANLQEQIDYLIEIGRLNAQINAGEALTQEQVTNRLRLQDTLRRRKEEMKGIAEITLAEERLAALRAGSAKEESSAAIQFNRNRVQSELSTAQQLAVLRQQERDDFINSLEFQRAAQERAEAARLSAIQQTAENIVKLQDEIANAGEGASLRLQEAYYQALRDQQKATEDARVSIIRSQVQIANQTIFNADRANAKVLEFIASQKDASEVIADSRISLIQSAFDGIDRAIGKLTQRLGIFKGFLQEILAGFAKLLVSRAFQALFGLSGPSSFGANSGVAPAGGGNFLNGLFGLLNNGGSQGGGNAGANGGSGGGLFNFGSGGSFFNFSGIGPGGTAGFNPSAGLGINLFGGGGAGTGGNVFGRILGLPAGNASGSGSSNFFRQLAGLNFGISAPSSISGAGAVGQVTGGASRTASAAVNAALGGGGLFSTLFRGIGFGKAPGSGGALAGLLPFLGANLGAGLGGDSTLGKILGGVGGGLLGIGLTAAPAILASGGALAGSLGFLAPLFSNPITAAIGAALLPAAILLGRAKARKRDEQTSGDYLEQAIDAIRQLRRDVANDRVTGERNVRDIFNEEILKTFIDQINTIKTKSVRESRLRNQTADLRNLFEREVIPEVARQKVRQTVNSRLIPEFATGGLFQGEGLAKLHDGEVILNKVQQSRLFAMTSPSIFKAIGVPNAPAKYENGFPAFESGGVMVSGGRSFSRGDNGGNRPLIANFTLTRDAATGLLQLAADTEEGQQIIVNTVRIDELRS